MRVWTAQHLVIFKPVSVNGSQDTQSWHCLTAVEDVVYDSFEIIPGKKKKKIKSPILY